MWVGLVITTVVLASLLALDWQPIWIAVISAVGGTVAGGVSWLIARRQSSGSVKTSDAETLWNVSERLIDRLTTEVEKLRGRVGAVEVEYENCRKRLSLIEDEVQRLRRLARDQ